MYSVWVSWHDMFCIFLDAEVPCHVFFLALYRWHGTYACFCFFHFADDMGVCVFWACPTTPVSLRTMQLLHPLLSLRSAQWIFYLALKRYSFCAGSGIPETPLLFAVPDWNVAESEIFGFRPRFLVLTAISFSYLTRKVWNCMCVTGCNIVTNRCCFYTPRNALKSCWPGYLSCLGAIFSKKRNSFTLLYSVYVLLNGSSICSGAQSLNFLCLIHDHAICNIDYITKDNKRTHWNCASRNAATSTVAHTVPTGSSRLRVGGSHFLFGFKLRVRG